MLLGLLFILLFSPFKYVDPKVDQEIVKKNEADIICILHATYRNLNIYSGRLDTKEQKGSYVYRALQKEATLTQKSILSHLKNQRYTHRSFYIINAIHIPKADKSLIEYLIKRPEVKRIEHNSNYQLHSYTSASDELNTLEARSPQVIQWGITMIKADTLWSLGIKGQGVVIGGEDTGVELHPLIKQSYRGSIANDKLDHNYNWHDAIHELHPLNRDTTTNEYNNPCGLDTLAPCDDDNHGTHTVGIMTATNMEIGVAPSAKWIACRCMERGWGTLASYIECFQWFLAPTDTLNKNPNPRKAPHIINNSWGCPPEEGCNASNFGTMEQVIKNLKAAGILVVASAGNSGGQGCSTVDDPAAMFEASFSVGATNIGDSIAGFSSKGPVTIDGSGRMKPNISAPGVGILSTIRRGGLAAFNGTSMSGPHVAGAVALLISAYPHLAGKVDIIENLLEKSALPKNPRIQCGNNTNTSIPNNVYGFGRLDVYNAYIEAGKLSTTSSKNESIDHLLTIFPNPSSDIIYVQNKDGIKIKSLKLYSISGKLIQFKDGNVSNKSISLNGAKGIFILSVYTDKGILNKRIVSIE